MDNYLVIQFKFESTQENRDILIAWLSEYSYDSFEENDLGLKAYILEDQFDSEILKSLPVFETIGLDYDLEKLNTINWNEEWERNYEPVEVDDWVYIRAPFHRKKDHFEHEIEIEPKMSFGTGHHFTTRLVVRQMRNLDFRGKKVLDMGTGTGILAILAEKLHAKEVLAIDNFAWAVENTKENAERNNCRNISVLEGDATSLKVYNGFDMVLANINRNVLLEDIPTYAHTMKVKGNLLLSGFFKRDMELIDEVAQKANLLLDSMVEEGDWVCCSYTKTA